MEKSKKNKIICPTCKGNGFVRIPYRLAKEEITAQCGVCDSEGEIDAARSSMILLLILMVSTGITRGPHSKHMDFNPYK